MRNVTDRVSDPFDLSPPCDRFVPGYGDPNADFHVIGDGPHVHGGLDSGVPFMDEPWSATFFETLSDAGLVASVDLDTGRLAVTDTFFSYLHACDTGNRAPTADEYADVDRYFDAELRAITAHVLVPVGRRATARVLQHYSSRGDAIRRGMEALHGQELRGSGFLVVPVREPADWTDSDADDLETSLRTLRRTSFEQVSDLGRFVMGDGPYFVR